MQGAEETTVTRPASQAASAAFTSSARPYNRCSSPLVRGSTLNGQNSITHARLGIAYDAATTSAAPDDVKVAGSTTRVTEFLNRSPELDSLYLHPPLLEACCRIIIEPFRLSTMHARTLRPNLPAQNLHVDFEPGPAGSMIRYNGSVWHGHTVNRFGQPQRSLQGAYIRRDAESGAVIRNQAE